MHSLRLYEQTITILRWKNNGRRFADDIFNENHYSLLKVYIVTQYVRMICGRLPLQKLFMDVYDGILLDIDKNGLKITM